MDNPKTIKLVVNSKMGELMHDWWDQSYYIEPTHKQEVVITDYIDSMWQAPLTDTEALDKILETIKEEDK